MDAKNFYPRMTMLTSATIATIEKDFMRSLKFVRFCLICDFLASFLVSIFVLFLCDFLRVCILVQFLNFFSRSFFGKEFFLVFCSVFLFPIFLPQFRCEYCFLILSISFDWFLCFLQVLSLLHLLVCSCHDAL